jgi:peptidyl-prolyl cis-trans isomerase B (cyclophilin B)
MSAPTLPDPRRRAALAWLTAASALLAPVAWAQQSASSTTAARRAATPGDRSMHPIVELHIAQHGVITLELDASKAPKTVENFLAYVRDGHYDGTIFHRVIDGFMIQGGGFEPGMKQKPTRAPIENEANNGLKNERYTIAMARTQAPHSATAQFFINVADNDFLNHTAPTLQGWGYAVFGRVIGGTEVVDAIRRVATTRRGFHDDVPVQDVVITKAVVVQP